MPHTPDHTSARDLARRWRAWMAGWWREAVRGILLVAMAMATWWAAMMVVTTIAAAGAS